LLAVQCKRIDTVPHQHNGMINTGMMHAQF
jgi:hypothetical protein